VSRLTSSLLRIALLPTASTVFLTSNKMDAGMNFPTLRKDTLLSVSRLLLIRPRRAFLLGWYSSSYRSRKTCFDALYDIINSASSLSSTR
jgi:hypothetical protein